MKLPFKIKRKIKRRPPKGFAKTLWLIPIFMVNIEAHASLTYCYDENNKQIAAPGKTIQLLNLDTDGGRGSIKVHAMCSGAPANQEVKVSIEQLCPSRAPKLLSEMHVCVFKGAELNPDKMKLTVKSFAFNSNEIKCSNEVSQTVSLPNCE